jgi:drug/metabolite transporter (DMT)-like permease
MPTDVLLLVLLAAFLHASWNAVVKSSPDKFLDIVFVTASAAMLCVLAIPFLPLPAGGSWPYIAVSAAIHVLYFVLIGAAYRSGDMSHAYPLMRGAPPLLVALASGPLIGERLSAGEWSGILLICAGILGLLMANPSATNTARTTRLALLNAATVAAYTLVDGTGVRLSGHPASYTMWMFALTAPPILAWAIARRKEDALVSLAHGRRLHAGSVLARVVGDDACADSDGCRPAGNRDYLRHRYFSGRASRALRLRPPRRRVHYSARRARP